MVIIILETNWFTAVIDALVVNCDPLNILSNWILVRFIAALSPKWTVLTSTPCFWRPRTLTDILSGGLTTTLNESKDLIQNASAKELDDLQKKLESAEKLLKDKANEKKPNVTESVNDNMV